MNVDGTIQTGAYRQTVAGAAVLDAPIRIENTGENAVYARIAAHGAPKVALPAAANGFDISRRYYTLDGQEADPGQVSQNTRLVVVIEAAEHNSWPSRVVIKDLLPAGFEIDNPRLVGSAELSNFGWLGSNTAAHAEFQDDRFVAAFNRTRNSERKFRASYVVRAVTPGQFSHPGVRVEDMYRPDLYAQSDAGTVTITLDDG